jgi:hypothetical protein
MKSISKPPLPIEIYTPWQNLSIDDNGKKPLVSSKISARPSNLTLIPTNVRTYQDSAVEDYGVKGVAQTSGIEA